MDLIVFNYYLEVLDEGTSFVELYDVPNCNGAPLYYYPRANQEKTTQTLYLGPAYCYSEEDIPSPATEYDATVTDAHKKI